MAEFVSDMSQEHLQEVLENSKPLDLDGLVADLGKSYQLRNEIFESKARCRESATLKSTKETIELRLRGNRDFKNGADTEATHLYTESIAVAPDDSEELALAYANRSASLLRSGKLIECLLDINRALEGNKYPENLRVKLMNRKEKCLNGMRGSTTAAQYTGIETDPIPTTDSDNALLDSMCKFGNRLIPRASPKIKLECDEKWGRHIVATEDIEPGEILSRQKFYLTSLRPSTLYKNCSYCFVRCYALIPCSSCTEMYCSKKCLLEAKEMYHEMECKMLKMNPKPFPEIIGSVRYLAIRALFTGTKQGTELRGLMDKLKVSDIFAEKIAPRNAQFVDDYLALLRMCRTFNSAVSLHINAALETIVWARLVGFFDHTANENNDRQGTTSENGLTEVEIFTAMLLLNHMGTLVTYPFNVSHITDRLSNNIKADKTVGVGVNILHSLVNHSCDANVNYLVRNREQLMFAKRLIKKGEQIFLSYAGNFADKSLEVRRSLQKRYNFICQCEACANDWPKLENLHGRRTEKYFNKPLAIVDFKQQLRPLIRRIENRGVSELSKNEILQSLRIILKYFSTHVERPSAFFVVCERKLGILMNLLFNESSREYMDASEIGIQFSATINFLRGFHVI